MSDTLSIPQAVGGKASGDQTVVYEAMGPGSVGIIMYVSVPVAAHAVILKMS